MRGLQTIRGWLIAMPVAVPVVPVRPEFPCGVRDCFEAQAEVGRDERHVTVECPVHGCRTTWDIVKPELKAQQIIRVQDGWHQHGTKRGGR